MDVSDLFIGARPGDFARITIKDTGMGMSPETLARAFEPLFSTKRSKGNSGLGLSIVYSIVRAHDGFLAAESHPEKGTNITIYLPLRSIQPSAADVTLNRTSPAFPLSLDTLTGNREHILVVEDEKPVRDLVTTMLSRLGYTVVSCANGHEALARCRERDFDLVLLDMIMPQMNGIDVINHLRDAGKQTQTLLMTGYGVDVEGADPETPILSKPFDIITLGQTVKKLLSPNTANAA